MPNSYYVLSSAGVERLVEHVNFVCQREQARLVNVVSYPKPDSGTGMIFYAVLEYDHAVHESLVKFASEAQSAEKNETRKS